MKYIRNMFICLTTLSFLYGCEMVENDKNNIKEIKKDVQLKEDVQFKKATRLSNKETEEFLRNNCTKFSNITFNSTGSVKFYRFPSTVGVEQTEKEKLMSTMQEIIEDKKVNPVELCPNEFKILADHFYKNLKSAKIDTNNYFIILEDTLIPKKELKKVSNIYERNSFKIESLNENYSIFAFEVDTYNNGNFILLFKSELEAKEAKSKIQNANYSSLGNDFIFSED